MQISVSGHIIEAALSLLLGMAAGFLYDFLRVIRRRIRLGIVTVITDILFWLIAALALFLLGFSVGGGRLHIYMTVLSFLGGIFYFYTISEISLIFLNIVADFLTFILRYLVKPLVLLYIWIKKVVFFLKKSFHYQKKWVTISNTQKRRNMQREKHAAHFRKDRKYEAETSGHTHSNCRSHAGGICVGDACKSSRKN